MLFVFGVKRSQGGQTMIDFSTFMIGGISVIALVIGWVEFAKRLGVSGTGCQVLAAVLGTLFVALSQAIQMGLVPEPWVPWITVVVVGLGGGLAAVGLYDMVKRRFENAGKL